VKQFKAKLASARGGGHTVAIPADVADAVGLKYGARVRGSFDGVAYRSSLMKVSGMFHLGVHKATVEAAGAAIGSTVAVKIELDPEPLPTDTVPPDLTKALAPVRAAWDKLSPSHKREHVKHVIDAKKPETRAKRIATTVAALKK
jgi:hypothetical protein